MDYAQLAAAQHNCQQTISLRDSSSLQIQEVAVRGQQLWCDTSTGVLWPLVPVLQRRHVFEAIHNLSHPGIRASKRLITSRFVWPGCATNVALWCRVPAVKQKHSDCTGNNSSGDNSSTWRLFFSRSCGHCGPPASIFNRVQIPPHNSGPHNKMAGSCAPHRHHSRSVCRQLYLALGGAFWCTGYDENRPRDTVLWSSVQHSWYPADHDHGLSSAEQWPRREVS